MRTIRCWLFALLILPLTIPASAKPKITKLTFDFAGRTRILYVVLPERAEPMPLVVLLHGSGRNGEIVAQAWKDLAMREGFMIAAPDAFESSGWGSLVDPPEFFPAIVEQVNAIHPVDASRVYLFGHSAGAAYALFLAVVDSNVFAATAIHAGALQASPAGLFEQAERKMPIAIWVGDRDPFFPVDEVERTRRLYVTNGFDIKVHLIPNHDHNYYVISDEVNAKAWDFLKEKRLQPEALPGSDPANP